MWVLFIAEQLLDVWWAIFVLLGIEKVRIVPGITATSPFDLYYMPYTHSLIGSVIWSIGAGLLYYLFRTRDGRIAAAIVGAAVFSHWVLDLLVHRPDLSMYDDTLKVGLASGTTRYLPYSSNWLFCSAVYFFTSGQREPLRPLVGTAWRFSASRWRSFNRLRFRTATGVGQANAVTTPALYAIFTSAVW